MASHAVLAAKLLRESAGFYRSVGQDNPELDADMQAMAQACETVAGMVERDPTGSLSLDSFAEAEIQRPATGLAS